MIYGKNREVVESARRSVLKKWRVRCAVVAASLEEAGQELFTFLSFPPSQWKGLRTTNALERINAEFRRRTKTQASLPNEDAVVLLLFGLLRTGQIRLGRFDGWKEGPAMPLLTERQAAWRINSSGRLPRLRRYPFLPLDRHYRWELAAAVEIVKQGNAARKVAEQHVELAVCDQMVLVSEARGGEERDRDREGRQRRRDRELRQRQSMERVGEDLPTTVIYRNGMASLVQPGNCVQYVFAFSSAQADTA